MATMRRVRQVRRRVVFSLFIFTSSSKIAGVKKKTFTLGV